MTFWKKNLRLA